MLCNCLRLNVWFHHGRSPPQILAGTCAMVMQKCWDQLSFPEVRKVQAGSFRKASPDIFELLIGCVRCPNCKGFVRAYNLVFMAFIWEAGFLPMKQRFELLLRSTLTLEHFKEKPLTTEILKILTKIVTKALHLLSPFLGISWLQSTFSKTIYFKKKACKD